MEGKQTKTVVCKLSVPLAHWGVVPFFKAAREPGNLRFEILSAMPMGDEGLLFDMRVTGHLPDTTVEEALLLDPGVNSVEVLDAFPNAVLFRIEIAVSPLCGIFQKSKVSPIFPMVIEHGTLTMEVASTLSKMAAFVQCMKGLSSDLQIMSVRPKADSDRGDLLTPRQREIFQLAMAAGYWEVPRRVHIDDIAGMMGIAKSTAAETLAMVENRLLHGYAVNSMLSRPEL